MKSIINGIMYGPDKSIEIGSAAPASEKQIKYAQDIINRINSALDEISAIGYPEYADEAAATFDKRTDMVASGPRDVIEYLRDVTRHIVFSECYSIARRNHDSSGVDALNPMKNK